jgi:hypothetical protein
MGRNDRANAARVRLLHEANLATPAMSDRELAHQLALMRRHNLEAARCMSIASNPDYDKAEREIAQAKADTATELAQAIRDRWLIPARTNATHSHLRLVKPEQVEEGESDE